MSWSLGALVLHWPRHAGVVAALMCLVGLAACGTTTLPAGVYTSQQYHFKITYPSGWQVIPPTEQPGAAAPLIVIITHTGAHATNNALISSLTIDVLDVSAIGGAQAVAAGLAKDKTLSPITLSGLAAYRDQPITQQGAGIDSAITVTHTDYFLIYGAYEYQMSVDALPGDASALDAMTNSFAIV